MNASLHSASHQALEHAEYASRIFAPFLSEGWQFIKLAAILPGELNYAGICEHCAQFLITGNTVEEIQKKIIDIRTFVLKNLQVDTKESYQDFINVFHATVGLASLTTFHSDVASSWRQIQGEEYHSISFAAGWTSCDWEMNPDELTFRNILNQPHNLNKLLFFNPDQLKLITNEIRFLIFRNDFGSGTRVTRYCTLLYKNCCPFLTYYSIHI